MSLNAHDKQALARIEDALASADPQFAARLSAFSRLADAGVMPERERIRGDRLRAVAGAILAMGTGGRETRGLIRWIAVAMWVSISLALISIAIVLGHAGPQTGCPVWQTAACARPSTHSAPPAHSAQRSRPSSAAAPRGG
ncbi:MAG: DUF3040 domain-containing protein [Trebonia sp.]